MPHNFSCIRDHDTQSSKAYTMNRILLVDDHPLLREGLTRLISSESGMMVCGTASSVQEALAMVEAEKPNLVITDLTLPGRNGIELIKDLGATYPEIPTIVLSMHDELFYAERVLRAGGRGYVMKDAPPDHLLKAIRTQKVRVILSDEGQNPAAAQQLAKDAGIKAPTALSFEYLQKPGTPGDTWATMMRLNARKLAEALQQP